jgi:hypothetical protein
MINRTIGSRSPPLATRLHSSRRFPHGPAASARKPNQIFVPLRSYPFSEGFPQRWSGDTIPRRSRPLLLARTTGQLESSRSRATHVPDRPHASSIRTQAGPSGSIVGGLPSALTGKRLENANGLFGGPRLGRNCRGKKEGSTGVSEIPHLAMRSPAKAG